VNLAKKNELRAMMILEDGPYPVNIYIAHSALVFWIDAFVFDEVEASRNNFHPSYKKKVCNVTDDEASAIRPLERACVCAVDAGHPALLRWLLQDTVLLQRWTFGPGRTT
jgi:hypothetical protein